MEDSQFCLIIALLFWILVHVTDSKKDHWAWIFYALLAGGFGILSIMNLSLVIVRWFK